MIAISFRFLAGRYHATPWGRHVNEGAVEWPPSPWRILRALIAVWKRTLPDLPKESVEPVLRSLAAPPEFLLPRASVGHARHFMPWFKKGADDRTLVFDTFVVLPRDAEVRVYWPDAALGDAQRGVLARILSQVNVLGRSESWCEARLLDGVPIGPDQCPEGLLSKPFAEGEIPAGYELVKLLCAEPGSAFQEGLVALGGIAGRRKKGRGTREVSRPIYDPAWNICAETVTLHQQMASDPPGSSWVPYLRPRDCFRVEPLARRTAGCRARPAVRAARYALDSTVLPLVTETLPIAETARRTLMGIYGRLHPEAGTSGGRSPILSGKDAQGRPLHGHRHAFYLPCDEDGDGRLDHLTLVAPGGFGPGELAALDRLKELRSREREASGHPLRTLLLGVGSLEECAAGPLAHSKVWVSATPYLATRYGKTRGRDAIDLRDAEARARFLVDDLRREFQNFQTWNEWAAGIPADSVRIEPILDAGAFRIAGRWRPLQFQRYRSKRVDDGGRRLAGAFRLTFREPIPGPLSLGHSSHFGMGLFLPAAEA